MSGASAKVQSLGGFVWSIAEILRGDFKQSEYGKVILPFIVLRRLDCILDASKQDVLEAAQGLPDGVDDATKDMILFGAAGSNIKVYNLSAFTFKSLKAQEPGQLHANLIDYITKFSGNVRDIFLDKFLFTDQLKRLNEGGILWQVFDRFTQIDLHPDRVSNIEMGYLFEDLIRRFSEISNETAGEHFTPREVIRLIVELLIANDDTKLTGKGIIRQVYDPACGTGGMLALTEEALKDFNPSIRVELFGQELNGESFGICKSDMLVTGHDPEQIAFGNTLTNDAHKGKSFHYILSNPPYGVDWKKYQEPIREEAETLGKDGRFGAGLPRVSDGQLLFLQHMISKMRDDESGSRIGIVMNGSPLFTSGAGSGESEIRRWMLEKDWVEAIVALPTDLFYNTGIQTYVWLLTNRKPKARRGKVQLVNASGERFWKSMRKSLGSKRREIPEEARKEIVRIYAELLNGGGDYGEFSKIFHSTDFGYREIRIERPLRLNFQTAPERIERLKAEKAFLKLDPDERADILNALGSYLPSTQFTSRDEFSKDLTKALKGAGLKVGASVRKAILSALSERDADADICTDKNGNPEPDIELRDHELVPLNEDWHDYVTREVTPFVPDAWVDEGHRDASDKQVGRIGYEINFNRYFYRYVPPRPLEEIDAELKALEAEDAEVTFAPMDALSDGLGGLDTSLTRPLREVAAGSYNYFADGDLLLAKVTPCFENGKKALARGLVNGIGFATSEVHVIRPDARRIHPRYLLYVLSSEDFRAAGMASMTGAGGLRRVSEAAVLDYRPRITDLPTQVEIADFLDRETARIDHLVDKKNQFGDLISEARDSLIAAAVTGDLDAEQDSSGQCWLCRLPDTWKAERAKFHFCERQDRSVDGQEELLSVSHITGVTRRSEKEINMFPAESNEGYKKVSPGDVVINTMWAWMGAMSVSMESGIISPSYGVYSPISQALRPAFVDMILRSKPFIAEATRRSKGIHSSRLRLYPDAFLDTKLPIPPLLEQDRLLIVISRRTSREDLLLKKNEKAKSLLLEFRAALIAAAVAGQVDVRTWDRRGDLGRHLDIIEREMVS